MIIMMTHEQVGFGHMPDIDNCDIGGGGFIKRHAMSR